MKYKLIALLFIVMSNCQIFNEDYNTTLTDVIELFLDLRKFYNARSIVIVYNRHLMGWDVQKIIIELMKQFSFRDTLSQAIDVINETQNKTNQEINSIESVFIMNIDNQKALDYYQTLMQNSTFSKYHWFIIFENGTNFDCEHPGKDMFNLTFDSQLIVKCPESTNIKKYFLDLRGEIQVVQIAKWNPGKKLKIQNREIERNMKGIKIRLAMQTKKSREKIKRVTEYLLNLLEALKSIEHFDTEVVIEEDELGHYADDKIQFYGLMGIMHQHKADMALSFTSMSRRSLEAADFLVPLMRVTKQIYVRVPDSTSIRWSAYFRVFDKYAWITFGFAILTFSILLIEIQRNVPNLRVNSFFENFIDVWGICSQQGISGIPSIIASKILYFSILLSSFILYIIYSATITSYIAHLEAYLPFSTYQEFLKHNYKVIVLRGSRDERAILRNDSFIGEMKPFLKEYDELPTNAYDGFRQACEDEKTAFYTDDLQYNALSNNLSCTLGHIHIRVESVSLLLAKNSPYTKILNKHILRMMANGVLDRLKNKFLNRNKEIKISNPNIIDFLEVLPILAIWVGGVIFSLILVIAELVVYNRKLCICNQETYLRKRKIKHFTMFHSN